MEAFKEGMKEVLRTSVMALVPLLISLLQSGTIDMPAVLISFAIALLSGLDKWLHKADKTIIPIEGATGLTGF